MIRSEDETRAWLEGVPGYDELARNRLDALAVMLREENSRQNLVSAGSLAELWRRHIADSAQLLRFVPRETSRWLDLGTGAGFPGLVVSILRPDLALVMVESRKRRVEWLERVRRELGLDHATVIGDKVEQLGELDPFGAISARAFAPLDKTLELSARFSTSDTLWLLPKGRSAEEELNALSGWQHTFHVEQSVTDTHSGIIVGTLAGRKGRRS